LADTVADHLDTHALLRIMEGDTKSHVPLAITPARAGWESVEAAAGQR
jgi:hypothetical protein